MPQTNSTFNINSKHFITRIENDIVQLVKTLIVEHQISIEEAKLMARRMVQTKLNQMLTEEEKKGIDEISKNVTRSIINGMTTVEDPRAIYELLKAMGFK